MGAPTCTHLAIFARDISRSVAFYRRYAGLLEVHRRVDDGVTVVWMGEEGRDDAFVIVIIEAEHHDAVEPGPLAHIGYAVESREKVDEIAAMAAREGLGPIQGPLDAGPIVGYLCIFNDPDGNAVEFSHGQALGPYA